MVKVERGMKACNFLVPGILRYKLNLSLNNSIWISNIAAVTKFKCMLHMFSKHRSNNCREVISWFLYNRCRLARAVKSFYRTTYFIACSFVMRSCKEMTFRWDSMFFIMFAWIHNFFLLLNRGYAFWNLHFENPNVKKNQGINSFPLPPPFTATWGVTDNPRLTSHKMIQKIKIKGI